MKTASALLLGLSAFLLLEGQSGSRTSPLSLDFDKVYYVHGGESHPKLHSFPIMTWNIDHGSDLEKLADAMAQNPAAICLLQEVDLNAKRSGQRDVAGELAQRLHMNGSFGIEFEELSQEQNSPAYIGQATLTQLPVRNSRVLRFERQSGFWKPHSWIPSGAALMQRRRGGRMALVSELEFNGRLLVVYNAHLESRSAGFIQDRQLDEMLEDAKRYPSGAAIILGGDLNTKYLPSVFLHKLEREDFRSATGERIERSHTIAMALDWIFVKGPIRIENGSVRYDIKGSEHYPVYATLARR